MITYQQEFLSSVKVECQYLIQQHWEEVELNKDTIKLNPDWDAYESLEVAGKLNVFTARDEGSLVGYFVAIVGTNLHHKDHLFAMNDIIFLRKDCRKGMTGAKLIKFAEDCLTEDGVSVLNINTKVHQPFDPLLERRGFNCIERVYSKVLGE